MIIKNLLNYGSRISVMLILLSFFLSTRAYAQTACTATLDQARIIFDEGRIHELEALLEPCLVSGFSPAEKTEALRLLILTHIYLEEPVDADLRMLELLRHEHEYNVNPALDPTEFINIYKTFRTNPIFSVGLKLGVNNAIVNATEVNGTYNLNGTRHEYNRLVGIQGGLSFEYKLNDLLTLNPEIYFMTNKFEKTSENTLVGGVNVTEESIIEEDQTWFQLPVSVQYKYLQQSKLNPYASLGVALDYLSAAETAGDASKNTVTRDNGLRPDQIVSLGTLSGLVDEREKLNFSIFIGTGIKYKVGEGHIVADLRFNYGLTEVVKGGSAYNSVTTWELHNANDTFKQHKITISVGYILDIYNPKKLTSKQLNKKLN